MEKKFNELTVKEFGDILSNGYAHIDDQTSKEHEQAQVLIEEITTTIDNHTKDRSRMYTVYVCRIIYPFYYIYKYATNQKDPGAIFDPEAILDEAKELCAAYSKATPTDSEYEDMEGAIKDGWQNFWDMQTKQTDPAKLFALCLSAKLKVVGKAINGITPNSRDWAWAKDLNRITLSDEGITKYSSTFYITANYICENVSQIVLTGAPGTGKTKVAKELADFFGADITWETDKNTQTPPKYKIVQFHPSYDYTDFVEGLRPVEVEKGKIKDDQTGEEKIVTELTFKKVDGTFKHFCRKVVDKDPEQNSEQKYFFIIDEINRADLSKVFGELMYCLEKDKRGSQNTIATQYQNVSTYDIEKKDDLTKDEDVFSDGFYIPENVVIIGTMNDIDRSVESMDMALRRRFVWHEVEVDYDLLVESLDIIFPSAPYYSTITRLAEKIDKFNQFMVDLSDDYYYGLNKHYYISQGQFTDLPGAKNAKDLEDILKTAWNLRIRGLIEEYVRGEDKAEEFVDRCEQAFLHDTGLENYTPSSGGDGTIESKDEAASPEEDDPTGSADEENQAEETV